VVVGIVVVWLLWRILQVQQVRAQVEVANVAVQRAEATMKTIVERIGTEDQAIREGRLIEYYEEAARLLGLSDDAMKDALFKGKNSRRALAWESLQRGKQCRFLDEMDYDEVAPKAYYPGPKPQPDMICSETCDETFELSYMPPDAKTCPFCGAPTKQMNPQHLEDEFLARWAKEDAAWQLWKKRSPAIAAKEEAEELARLEANVDEERAEFEKALAEFKATGAKS